MYPNPIALSDGAATVNFDYRGSSNDKSVYKVSAAELNEPRSLTISHTESGKGANKLRSTLIRFDRTYPASAETDQNQTNVYLVIRTPIGSEIVTEAYLAEELNLMKSFLSAAGNIDRVIAAEI